MSLSLKITSLLIRTAAKPIGNWIKGQAREHERFRRTCVAFAQRLHRLDMHLRLGLLQDPAAIDRQIAREAAEAEAKRRVANAASSIPTVKTEAQAKADAEALAQAKKQIGEKVKDEEKKKEVRRIRPLSEAKAIDSGANFISEAFLFMVAAGLIVGEAWRGRRKEGVRRDEVQGRLDKLEEEINKVDEEKRALMETVEVLKGEIERVTTVGGGGTEEVKQKVNITGVDRGTEDVKTTVRGR